MTVRITTRHPHPRMPNAPNKRVIDFRYAPPSRWTCIGRPDDHSKTVIREDGALLYDYVHPVKGGRLSGMFHSTIGFQLASADRPLRITQENEEAGNSIVVTTIQYPRASLTLRSFGHADADGRRTDVVLWRIQASRAARNLVAALAVSATYHRHRSAKVGEVAGRDLVVVEDAPVDAPPPPRVPLVVALSPTSCRRAAEPMDWYNFAAAYGLPPVGVLSRMALLDEGEALEGAVLIPRDHQEVDPLDYEWARRALIAERKFWKRQRIPRLAIRVQDPAVQQLVDACARNILQAREVRDGLPEFQVGPTCYRNLWVVDGYYLLQAAHYLGLHEDAERGTRALLRRVQPDGAIREIPEHTMETMISVATLVRQAELSGDHVALEERWPAIMNAVRFVRGLREDARRLDPEAPEYGLLPKAYADGGMGGMRAEYLTTLWTLAGLHHALRAARWLGKGDDASVIESDYQSLMRDFRAHAKRDQRILPGGVPYLRMWMRGQSDHITNPRFKGRLMPWQKLGPGSGTWAFCQAIYTGEVFAPDDPLVLNLLRLFDVLDNRQGLPEATGWLTDRSIWPYAGAFAAQVWLYAGNADKAVDYLYAFANHAAPTRVWREEQSLDFTGHGHANGDMPHNWASAEFIHLVRNLLVVEREDRLELLSGLPPEWVRPGSRNTLEKTPTRFGPVTVDCRIARTGAGVILVRRDPRRDAPPGGITLKLPSGAARRTVTVNGHAPRFLAPDVVLVPSAASVRVTFSLRS